jgi:phage tail sheath protein FI
MAEIVAYFAIKSIGMSTCGGRKPQMLIDAARHNLREIQAEQGASSHIDASRIKDNVVLFGPPTAKEVQANAEALQPASARVAGMIARSDNDRGFWWSPSNTEMYGITGTARSVDFTLGDVNARANYLNENEVATIIQKDGYRLWGNRTCSADPKWAFLSVRRTADMINESMLRAHMWAVDRNITKTYVQDVLEGVNSYLRHLTAVGAILGGKAWADPALNTPDQISQGKVYFDFDFTPPYPAEHITFRSRLVNDYIEEIFK